MFWYFNFAEIGYFQNFVVPGAGARYQERFLQSGGDDEVRVIKVNTCHLEMAILATVARPEEADDLLVPRQCFETLRSIDQSEESIKRTDQSEESIKRIDQSEETIRRTDQSEESIRRIDQSEESIYLFVLPECEEDTVLGAVGHN